MKCTAAVQSLCCLLLLVAPIVGCVCLFTGADDYVTTAIACNASLSHFASLSSAKDFAEKYRNWHGDGAADSVQGGSPAVKENLFGFTGYLWFSPDRSLLDSAANDEGRSQGGNTRPTAERMRITNAAAFDSKPSCGRMPASLRQNSSGDCSFDRTAATEAWQLRRDCRYKWIVD
jgi:hypothetical protein